MYNGGYIPKDNLKNPVPPKGARSAVVGSKGKDIVVIPTHEVNKLVSFASSDGFENMSKHFKPNGTITITTEISKEQQEEILKSIAENIEKKLR